MSPKPASTNPSDAHKTRGELLAELQELRAQNAVLKDAGANKGNAEALRGSEEKFREMAENIGEVFFSFTRDWKHTIYVSPAYEHIWGRPLEEVYGNPMAWLEGVHPDDRELPLAVVNRYIAGDFSGIDTVEFRVLRPDGTVRWILARTYPVRNDGGEMYRITGIAEDITERMLAEEKVAHVASFPELNPNPVIEVDYAGNVTYSNPSADRIYPDLRASGDHHALLRDITFGRGAGPGAGSLLVRDVEVNGRFYLESIIDMPERKVRRIYCIDITERKRAEEALKLTQFVVDNFRDSSIWLTRDGRIAYVNQETCRGLGYSREELLSMHISDIDPDYPPEKFRELWPEKQKGDYTHFESRHVAKDGRTFPVEVTSTYTIYGDNEYLITFDRDITERKRTEEALRSSQSMLKSVMGNVPLGIFWKDRSSTYLGCNEVFAKAVGLSSTEEIVGKTDYDLPWLPEEADSFRDYDFRIMENDEAEYHIVEQQREADGKISWVETNKVPLHDAWGKVVGILGTYEDITERKRTEKEREITVEFLSLVNQARSTQELIWKTASFFQKTSGCEAVGIRLREEDDYPYYEARGFRPEFIRKENLLCTRDAQGHVLRDKDGFPMLDCMCGNVITGRFDPAMPFFTAKGSFWTNSTTELLATTTEKHRLAKTRNVCNTEGYESFALISLRVGEERLGVLQLNDRRKGYFTLDQIQMWERLADYLAVALAKFQADEALKNAKTQAELYLDLMGHDINNLHQIALGYLELAREMPASEGRDEFLDKPVEVLQRSAQLIQNVRKLQKLREGGFTPEMIDVCNILADVQSEYRAEPGKTIRVNLGDHEKCFVSANGLLHDVFANLVDNAVKHTDDRTDITVSLDVMRDRGRPYYKVAVEDNGPGIPDDSKEMIFNRLHKGTAKGMGLGLYLVKSLVESYHGKVWVEDRVQGDHTKGARFVVILPAVEK